MIFLPLVIAGAIPIKDERGRSVTFEGIVGGTCSSESLEDLIEAGEVLRVRFVNEKRHSVPDHRQCLAVDVILMDDDYYSTSGGLFSLFSLNPKTPFTGDGRIG